MYVDSLYVSPPRNAARKHSLSAIKHSNNHNLYPQYYTPRYRTVECLTIFYFFIITISDADCDIDLDGRKYAAY